MKAKSLLATVIGWLIVALVAYWLLGVVIGTIRFIVRFIVWIVLLGLLLTAYVRLKASDD